MTVIPAPAIEAYVDAAAALIGLPLAPPHRDEAIAALATIMEHADLVLQFALPETTEAAPRFVP